MTAENEKKGAKPTKKPPVKFKTGEDVRAPRLKRKLNQGEFWSRINVTQSGGRVTSRAEPFPDLFNSCCSSHTGPTNRLMSCWPGYAKSRHAKTRVHGHNRHALVSPSTLTHRSYHMKTIVLAALLAVVTSSSAMAADATCAATAREKKLAGAAKTSFLTKCERDANAACDFAAAEKKLSGAAKTSFTKKCFKDRVGGN